MKKLLLALATLFVLTTIALADPITINVSQTPRGIIPNSDLPGPCGRNLLCKRITSATTEIYNESLQLIGTINATPPVNGAVLTLDIGQSGIVNLGGFTFTGQALTALPLDYSYLVGIGAGGSIGNFEFWSSLSLNNNALTVTSFKFPGDPLPPIVTLTKGERFQLGGVTNANGNLSISITRLGPASEVPEPATLLLLGSGVAGLAALRRRRKL